jgi:hypothetical protein
MLKKEEMRKIFAILNAEFGHKVLLSEERLRIWQVILGHASYDEVMMAVVRLLGVAKQFPPTVGEVNQAVLEARRGTKADWGSLWSLVEKAGRNSSYNAAEEAAKLPAEALAAIGGVSGLKELAGSSPEHLAVIRAQFRQRLEAATNVRETLDTEANLLKSLPTVNVKQIG